MTRRVAVAKVAPRPKAVELESVKPVHVANGTLEAMKWLALVLMTLDHVNKYLFSHTLPGAFQAGRLAMPIFVFVLAYNLARPGGMTKGAYLRTGKRLGIYGAIACIPYMALGTVLGGWWPLNIMFTLLAATAMFGLIDHGGRGQSLLAVAVFAGAGSLVEYWWPALAIALAAWYYCKAPTRKHLVWLTVALAALGLVNQNLWAMAALPLTVLAPRVELAVPRVRHLFYVYYPAHLAIIWVIQRLMP
jgi:hypothetical protein